MSPRSHAQLGLGLLFAACRTAPDDPALSGRDAGRDLAIPRVADLAYTGDLSCVEPDLAPPAPCPCGADGLCRGATGRLSVQTQSPGGVLAITVMDDNGCRRRQVSSDHPIGVPRWAPDHERLAYLSGDRGAVLHVLRIGPAGDVICRAEAAVDNVRALELAWASDDELWLGTHEGLVRWKLGVGVVAKVGLPIARFDASGDGPLAVVQEDCGPQCRSQVAVRAQVQAGPLKILDLDAMLLIGPVRLSPSADAVVFERAGWSFAPVQGGPVQAFGQPGDRSPAFAVDGHAVVFATDDGRLRYHFLSGPEAGRDLDIPSSWQFVFSPDWAPPPLSCGQPTTCM